MRSVAVRLWIGNTRAPAGYTALSPCSMWSATAAVSPRPLRMCQWSTAEISIQSSELYHTVNSMFPCAKLAQQLRCAALACILGPAADELGTME